MRKIFISSVQKEFKADRVALREFIIRDPLCQRYFDVFLFENIPARDRHPDSVYLEEVRKCDVYVCLLGNEYGVQDSGGVSATEFEQRGAQFVLTIRRKKTVRPEPPTQSATQSADPVIRLLSVLQQGEMSAGHLRVTLKIKHRPTFRVNYLHPALEKEFIEYTTPDKPSSRLQKYRLTQKGMVYLKKFLKT